jgi:hypothetical protein
LAQQIAQPIRADWQANTRALEEIYHQVRDLIEAQVAFLGTIERQSSQMEVRWLTARWPGQSGVRTSKPMPSDSLWERLGCFWGSRPRRRVFFLFSDWRTFRLRRVGARRLVRVPVGVSSAED